MSTEKDDKTSILLKHAESQHEMNYKMFSSIDAKYAWLLAFLLTSLTFIIPNFLLKDHSDLLIFSVITGLVALGLAVFGFLPRTFQIGSGSSQVTIKFWPDDKTVQSLKEDLLSNYNAGNDKNSRVIEGKVFMFKAAVAVAVVYVTSFVIFLTLNYDLLSR